MNLLTKIYFENHLIFPSVYKYVRFMSLPNIYLIQKAMWTMWPAKQKPILFTHKRHELLPLECFGNSIRIGNSSTRHRTYQKMSKWRHIQRTSSRMCLVSHTYTPQKWVSNTHSFQVRKCTRAFSLILMFDGISVVDVARIGKQF